MTEITQADREAARELLRSLSTGAQMVMGAGPGTLYETFARHRTTAHAEGFAQGYAAAKAQAVGVAKGETGEAWSRDVIRFADRITTMEPGA